MHVSDLCMFIICTKGAMSDVIDEATAPQQGGTNPEENAANVLDQRMHNEAMELVGRSKFVIAVLVLLLLKFIFDNVVPCSLILCITYSLLRIRNGLELQLNLKKKSSCVTVLNLLFLSIFLLFTTVQFANAFGIPDRLISRLTFMYAVSKPSHPITFMNTIWSCVIVDGMVQAGVTALKLTACLMLGTNTMKCGQWQWKHMFNFGEFPQIQSKID